MKITANDLIIERMRENHDVSGFQSYERELVDFLVEDALDNQFKRISATYLWFLQTGELVGYISLLNDRINLEGGLKTVFREKGVLYKALPALKIGRLCVDDRYLRMGIGTLMVAFATKVAHRIFEGYSGCRFIVLDAKRNKEKDAIHFYKRIGFKTFKERKKGTSPMFLDLVNNSKFNF
jgi:ribosomal protein S18 acetylase RimI-like enzyme